MSKIYTAEELSTHDKPDNLWLAVDGDVYELTTFQEEHPVLQRFAGKDASKQFWKYHNKHVLSKYQGRLRLGSLDTKSSPATQPTTDEASQTRARDDALGSSGIGPGTATPAPVPTEDDPSPSPAPGPTEPVLPAIKALRSKL